ncbi:MAG: precorrin-4 C(11)-methyltransferase [Spirochaetaceae bacterium]|nr:precorrin-4 C(11)-methyltransferase [Spirochaetaceae bacterium]
MIYFIGAGPGAPDLITLRGRELLGRADRIIYAGSLVNPELLGFARASCKVLNSAALTLEEVIAEFAAGERQKEMTVRLHTGDPSLYGAVREQMEALDLLGLAYEVVPGVSSFCAAAGTLGAEYTLPGVSQSLIITRAEGRTSVPRREGIAELASHGASMAIFLSAGLLAEVQKDLLAGGYSEDTPAALVYRVSWPDEKVLRGTVGTLLALGEENRISKTALILVGDFLRGRKERSRLYDPAFSHGFRPGPA